MPIAIEMNLEEDEFTRSVRVHGLVIPLTDQLSIWLRLEEEGQKEDETHREHDGSNQSAKEGAPHGFDREVDSHFLV